LKLAEQRSTLTADQAATGDGVDAVGWLGAAGEGHGAAIDQGS
jgi:hypothetical protein